MIGYDLLMAFLLALLVWALVRLTRVLDAQIAAQQAQTAVAQQLVALLKEDVPL